MKILIIGKGAREHALCWKSAQSPLVSQVFIAPGNDGIKNMATCVAIAETDCAALVKFAKQEGIDLTIVGPEASLVAGIVDQFMSHGLLIWGPTQQAAQIEGSKAFAKKIMTMCGVTTAAYESFTQPIEAKAYIQKMGLPIVIKADGLAAGKGVVIPATLEEAFNTIDDMLTGNRFGQAGALVVIEEFLEGEEFSLMAFVHGDRVIPMVMAQDHKRAYDQDKGPNTGGMGAYAPVFSASSQEVLAVTEEIIKPVVQALNQQGMPFTGFLYAGIILTAQGFKVIEFNARFGDPEAEVILPLLDSDLIEIIHTLLTTNLVPEIKWRNEFVIGVILAAEGYPDNLVIDKPLKPFSLADNNNFVFYGSVTEKDDVLYSTGGRILLAVAIAATFKEAYDNVYQTMSTLASPATFYRKDIGYKQLKRKV